MNFKDADLVKISKLTSQQIDNVTCLECCKYYIAPETAACGHTLCHSCWHGRRTCPLCAKPFERHNVKYNGPIQNLTEHVHELGEAFEKLFNIKLDEFLLDTGEVELENDPTKNVKDWLASSQNHFSAPPHSSEQSSQEIQQHPNPLNVSSNKIQIHTNISKSKSPEKVIHVPLPQDDWDKIEIMPDTEDNKKNKENVVGPMDIEPFNFDYNEYTVNNPRRSSRKREHNPTEVNNKINENTSVEKQSSKDSSGEIDKKSNKIFQKWNNVKRMRKEFSKLNKINRNKLNVSIEMCKKTQSTAKTTAILPEAPSPQIYDIDENTPDHYNIKTQMKEVLKERNNIAEDAREKINISTSNEKQMEESSKQQTLQNVNHNQEKTNDSQETNAETVHSSKHEAVNESKKPVKMPFYKRSALYKPPKCIEENTIKAMNHIVDSNTNANDDIEITIKVGNTITNILIKKKNDMELKVKTDREIQTSLGQHEVIVNNSTYSQNTKSQNIEINIGDSNKVDVKHQSETNPRTEELRKIKASIRTVSDKKNTDSADTATAQFEITESVEKELSKVMECVDLDEPVTSNITPVAKDKSSQNNNPVKPTISLDDLEYLNDLDIFESESVKDSDVKLLKNTEYAPSEILLCTFKSKNKTQKHIEKRGRDSNDAILPTSKKAKLDNENSAIVPKTAKQNQTESEPMNYDAIMGSVFASIDADIEENRQSQNTDKNTYQLKDNNNKEFEQTNSKATQHYKAKEPHKVVTSGTDEINSSIELINEYQKNSENIFSVCVEKEDENVDNVPTNKKVLLNVPPPNIEEFLTPVMCRNLESTGQALIIDKDVEMGNDDSESIVEETPQKTTSFSKIKQKSNGANKDVNQSQRIKLSGQRVLSDKKSSETTNIKSIVNITDTSTELKSSDNATVIEIVDAKSLETPLNINKFVEQIQHKSTPYARKSLNFDTENMDIPDPEQTLCQTIQVAKTTQEKEFMSKAFEKTPTTPAVRPLGLRNLALKNKRFKIAGSCLTIAEIAKLKLLCSQRKWTYSDKYSKDLTHLVVGIDDENKSQRSVKYMCALASSIWIISFEWVEKCLLSNDIVGEEYFEALDSTGEPGPRRSRLANKKLFQGITFFCMEPFGVLDVDTLKGMLEAAGGRVVKEVKEVRVSDKSSAPAIFLAEPENTQEDRFIYLAMELSIVPVNYEWVLNCLGSYTLGSIQELLLCPATLLPKATEKWPQELLARDDD